MLSVPQYARRNFASSRRLKALVRPIPVRNEQDGGRAMPWSQRSSRWPRLPDIVVCRYEQCGRVTNTGWRPKHGDA
jgi:hypothetical protein